MVGGSTRVPKVKELLDDYFKKPLDHKINPDEAVAAGASYLAFIEQAKQANNGPTKGGLTEIEEMCIIDVNPISLGIRLHDGKVSTLIKKNSPVPTRETKRYTNQEDNQAEIAVCIMQGDSPHGGQIREEHCKPIAEFNIGPFHGMKAKQAMVEITFTVD